MRNTIATAFFTKTTYLISALVSGAIDHVSLRFASGYSGRPNDCASGNYRSSCYPTTTPMRRHPTSPPEAVLSHCH